MATEKMLNTRIQLKYDSLANWEKDSFILKKGELAIVTVDTVEGSTLQPVMFKVGDGSKKFTELNWASAKAADVYAWAKKSGIEINDNGQGGKFVAGISWENNKLVVTRTNVEWSDVQNKVMASASADGLMSKEDKVKLDTIELADGKITVDLASGLDATGIEQVKGIKVTNAESAELAAEAAKVTGTLTINETTYNGSTNVDITDAVKSAATSAVEALIKASDDTNAEVVIENVNALVDYVNKNAGDIAQLVTDVSTANTNASNAVKTAGEAKTTAEGAAAVAGEAKTLAQEAKTAATTAQNSASASATAAAASAGEAAGSATAAAGSAGQAAGSATAAGNAQAEAEKAQAAAEAAQGKAEAAESEAKKA